MGRQAVCYSHSLFLLVTLCWAHRLDTDNKREVCSHCDSLLFCNCSYRGFKHIPVVTEHAVRLDLSFNNITEVTFDDLTRHAKLRALSLHGNSLALIHPSAFDSLWNLEELDLSNNQLTALNYSWFMNLGALQQLNLFNNPYSCLGSPPVFEGLIRLRRLTFGGPALKEIWKEDLKGVTELEELTIHANNLESYESGALANMWPIGRVTLSLHGPFSTNSTLPSALLADVSYPDTHIVLVDIDLTGNKSVQHLREAARRRIRSISVHNVSLTDASFIDFLVVMNGVPLNLISVEDATLTGTGRWEQANWTDHKSIDEFFLRNLIVPYVYYFVSFLQLGFLLRYPRKVSVINAQIFVMPCPTSSLLENIQYLDMSDNQLTDLTLKETLCHGNGTMQGLRVLNISGNALKSFSQTSQLVTKLYKLTHLDISRNGYISMPQGCSWPHTLRHFNLSRTGLTTVTNCLPKTLEVLDLSYNNLRSFSLPLPILRELYLSGNKFLRLPQGYQFPNLQTLTIQFNTLNMFGHSDLQDYRRLQSLKAGQNKFFCSCDFVNFFQFGLEGTPEVHIMDNKESYTCDSPFYLQGTPVGNVRLSVAECHQVLFISVSCGVALCFALMVCVLLWRIHAFWYLKMAWAWIRAKRTSMQRQKRDAMGAEALLPYDAFVSYSDRDASWVENFLVPELEGPRENGTESSNSRSQRPLTLCLHKRDFIPGQWIMDNIMSAMERSRRTIFILSENFVQSEWCRYELDFSHFWFFHGNTCRDTLILILLEPLSKDNIPKRFCKLRKLMSSTTYLEWPQEEERIEEFWKSLHVALRLEIEDN